MRSVQPAAEVETPHDALVDDDWNRLPADLAQQPDFGAKIEAPTHAGNDFSCFVALREQGSIERLRKPLPETRAARFGILEERQRRNLLHERQERARNTGSAIKRTA